MAAVVKVEKVGEEEGDGEGEGKRAIGKGRDGGVEAVEGVRRKLELSSLQEEKQQAGDGAEVEQRSAPIHPAPPRMQFTNSRGVSVVRNRMAQFERVGGGAAGG